MAIVWKPWIQVQGPPTTRIAHRALSMTIWTRQAGAIEVASYYGPVKENMQEKLVQARGLMRQVAAADTQWIIGGDFNIAKAAWTRT